MVGDTSKVTIND